MPKDKGWEFLFGEDKKQGSYSDDEGNEGYIYSDGSGYFRGADGSDGYIYSDGSGYYHGADGSDGYKYSDGSGYFRGGKKNVDAYQYSDGSGYYEDQHSFREHYDSVGDISERDGLTSNSECESGNIGIGGTLLGLGLVGIAAAVSMKLSSKNKETEAYDTEDDGCDNETEEVFKSNRSRNDFKYAIICLCIMALIPVGIFLGFFINKTVSESQGKISAGYYKDLVEEDYQAVEAHFRAAGFTNIELIDLNDSGLAFWKNEKVALISIGGNTDFESTDYFHPDTPVVISYH